MPQTSLQDRVQERYSDVLSNRFHHDTHIFQAKLAILLQAVREEEQEKARARETMKLEKK